MDEHPVLSAPDYLDRYRASIEEQIHDARTLYLERGRDLPASLTDAAAEPPPTPAAVAALEDIAVEESDEADDGTPLPLCRHLLAAGIRCRCVARKGTGFCRFHQELRRRTAARVVPPASPRLGVDLPSIEDRAGIQLAINDATHAYALGQLKDRQFRNLLYALSLAMQNVAQFDVAHAGEDEYIDPELWDDDEEDDEEYEDDDEEYEDDDDEEDDDDVED